VSDEQETKPLTGRARSLANLKRNPKGVSGNPSGRPKDLRRFGDILMKEFYKTVAASLGGKTVNKMQGEIVAQQMVTPSSATARFQPMWSQTAARQRGRAMRRSSRGTYTDHDGQRPWLEGTIDRSGSIRLVSETTQPPALDRRQRSEHSDPSRLVAYRSFHNY
jgi:uncharacterized protein DUF5681